MDVKHVTGTGEGAFVVERDGQRIAEMTYTAPDAGRATVDHTWVSDELRGQGVARELLDALVAWARADGV
ncbi:MAG: N-acetyltransferase, partial [Myxococcales bacterium]|nr:N-acetyltransferase [Myxococcales bacterium]